MGDRYAGTSCPKGILTYLVVAASEAVAAKGAKALIIINRIHMRIHIHSLTEEPEFSTCLAISYFIGKNDERRRGKYIRRGRE